MKKELVLRSIDYLPPTSTVLPSQYFFQPKEYQSGEKKLMQYMLEYAIGDYLAYAGMSGRRAKRLFKEDHEWFFSDENKFIYSFPVVCQHLNLDIDYIRQGLRNKTSRMCK